MADGYRAARARLYAAALESSWLTKLGAAAGFAGLTALLAQVSIPVPWTPVPLTLQSVGFLLTGVALGPRWGLLSLLLYLGAGVAGLHVFAPSADAFNPDALWSADRWRVLVPDAAAHTGFTAGYLVGFPLASLLVGRYLRARWEGRSAAFALRASWLLAILLVAVAGGAFFLGSGGSFKDSGSGTSYQAGADAAWLFAAAFLVLAPLAAWLLARRSGSAGREALNLFVVLLGATAIVHALGVLVLAPTLGLSWTKAVALGSTVFLPFDALKAALVVLAVPAFLPPSLPSSPPSSSPGESP
jgi:biotin transport system substrate-specific component